MMLRIRHILSASVIDCALPLLIGITWLNSPVHAQGISFWINGSGDSAGGQSIGELDANGTTGYIWGQTESDRSLVNLSLNLVWDSDAVAVTSINVLNPVINPAVGFPPKELVRYEFDSPGNVLPEFKAVAGFGGFSVTNAARIGAGFGADTRSAAPAGFLDPNYDATNDAFLIASFDYSISGDPSNAGLWLQISPHSLNYAGGRSADVEVVFGDPNDPPLNGETDRSVNSATVDAVFIPSRFPGDANGDLAVNLLDFQILSDNFGITGSGTFDMGDFNGDRNIDLLDFDILQENYGVELPVPTSAILEAQVPEPQGGVLLAIGLALLCTCRIMPRSCVVA